MGIFCRQQGAALLDAIVQADITDISSPGPAQQQPRLEYAYKAASTFISQHFYSYCDINDVVRPPHCAHTGETMLAAANLLRRHDDSS